MAGDAAEDRDGLGADVLRTQAGSGSIGRRAVAVVEGAERPGRVAAGEEGGGVGDRLAPAARPRRESPVSLRTRWPGRPGRRPRRPARRGRSRSAARASLRPSSTMISVDGDAGGGERAEADRHGRAAADGVQLQGVAEHEAELLGGGVARDGLAAGDGLPDGGGLGGALGGELAEAGRVDAGGGHVPAVDLTMPARNRTPRTGRRPCGAGSAAVGGDGLAGGDEDVGAVAGGRSGLRATGARPRVVVRACSGATSATEGALPAVTASDPGWGDVAFCPLQPVSRSAPASTAATGEVRRARATARGSRPPGVLRAAGSTARSTTRRTAGSWLREGVGRDAGHDDRYLS